MFSTLLFKRLLAVTLTFVVISCTDDSKTGSVPQQGSQPTLTVYKSATCQCCRKWINHLNKHDITTIAHNRSNLTALKLEKGIAPNYQSCHTAISSDGYVFEGHIPAKFIDQFLKEKPLDAIGLSVPGMPVGSPGMAVGTKFMPYEVLMLKADGTVETYAKVNSKKDQF